MTNAVAVEKIDEIIAGCEGVTPGPWTWGAQWLCRKIDKGQAAPEYEHLAQVPLNDYDSPRWNTDAAHIARLDPATVLALCEMAKASLIPQAAEGEQVGGEAASVDGHANRVAHVECSHCRGTGQPGGVMGGPDQGLCSWCRGSGRALSASPSLTDRQETNTSPSEGEAVRLAKFLSEAQDVLATYIVPGSRISDTDCVNELLGILDRRDVVLAVRAALSTASTGDVRAEALEEAAKVADLYAADFGAVANHYGAAESGRTTNNNKLGAARSIAAAIRALAEKG